MCVIFYFIFCACKTHYLFRSQSNVKQLQLHANSFILNVNDLLTYLLLLLPMTANFGYWFYAFSVYSPVNSICYTFGGFLDILIMFERLQLFSKRFKLFSKLSAKQWSAMFFVISLFVVVPIKVYLTPLRTTVVFNSNETSEIYKTGVYIP